MARENTVNHSLYVHGGGESTDEYSELWDYEAEQQETFHYAGYEEVIDLEVDLDTGEWRYIGLNGIKLEHPSGWMPGNKPE